MRWILAAILLLELILIPGPWPRPQGSPYFAQVQSSFENAPKTALLKVACLHRETVEDIIDIWEAENKNAAPSQYVIGRHIRAGECIALPEPTEMTIDEYGPLRSTLVVPEGFPTGKGVLYRAIRIKKYWTAMRTVVHQS